MRIHLKQQSSTLPKTKVRNKKGGLEEKIGGSFLGGITLPELCYSAEFETEVVEYCASGKEALGLIAVESGLWAFLAYGTYKGMKYSLARAKHKKRARYERGGERV